MNYWFKLNLIWLALFLGSCAAYSSNADFGKSRLHAIVAAETRGALKDTQLSEEDVQVEVDRLLALRPNPKVPSKLVIYDLPSGGRSRIRSPRKRIELRKTNSRTMKESLEQTGIFQEVDFLPDMLLPEKGSVNLKTLRIAAARAHADRILIYATEAGYEYRPNGLAAFYPTLVGLLLPGSSAYSTALSKAVLLDVKTGYIYFVMETYGDSGSGFVSYVSLNPELLEFEARTKSVAALSDIVSEKVTALKEKSFP